MYVHPSHAMILPHGIRLSRREQSILRSMHAFTVSRDLGKTQMARGNTPLMVSLIDDHHFGASIIYVLRTRTLVAFKKCIGYTYAFWYFGNL